MDNFYLASKTEEMENRNRMIHNLKCNPNEIIPYENTKLMELVNETLRNLNL